MIKLTITVIAVVLMHVTAIAATNGDTAFAEMPMVLHTATGDIHGTLTLAEGSSTKSPVALIIAGSGPTDRNGNNPMMKNGSLQKLAYGLATNHIASVRFDKRGIGESAGAGRNEADLRLEDYINDAKQWIALLKQDKRFSKVIVVGHSEGSLIGMIAALHAADGFVSIAGAGKSADRIIKEQLANQPQQVRDLCLPIIDSLVAGKTVANVNPMLFSLFRPSVQPYLISWFHYDPQIEIQKLTVPVLIIQGTADLQVTEEDAALLAKASPHAKLVLVKGMNHIFRIIAGDRSENMASYNKDALPISNELVKSTADFINTL